MQNIRGRPGGLYTKDTTLLLTGGGSRRAGQPAPEDGSTHGISAGERRTPGKMPAPKEEAEWVALMMQMPSQEGPQGGARTPRVLSPSDLTRLVSAPWPPGLLHPPELQPPGSRSISLFSAHNHSQLSSQPQCPISKW